ncbi:MAG: 50S ribosomal protein L10 [Gammaproteobacteria bacterium]|nr:MAG: 50S ribosomal protein L10 [Gammaproteobacteria bacterium]
MSLNLEQKKAIVAELSEVAGKAHSAIAAEYLGLDVAAMTALRAEARKANVYLKVVRNTLARRALDGTDFGCMTDSLTGPLLLAFSIDDPGAAARVIQDFRKEHEDLKVRLVAIGGKLLEAEEIKTLANLPTWEQAVSQLMAVMKAPISQFVRTMAEPHAKLVRTLAAVRDQKQAA